MYPEPMNRILSNQLPNVRILYNKVRRSVTGTCKYSQKGRARSAGRPAQRFPAAELPVTDLQPSSSGPQRAQELPAGGSDKGSAASSPPAVDVRAQQAEKSPADRSAKLAAGLAAAAVVLGSIEDISQGFLFKGLANKQPEYPDRDDVPNVVDHDHAPRSGGRLAELLLPHLVHVDLDQDRGNLQEVQPPRAPATSRGASHLRSRSPESK